MLLPITDRQATGHDGMTDSDQQDGDRHPTGEVPGTRLVTVPEAARRLGVTPDAIRSRLRRGTLTGMKIGDAWQVQLPAESLETDASEYRQDVTGRATGETVGQQDTDRTRQDASTGNLEPMAQLIGDLARRNEELSAAVGMWQARAMHLEERIKQLSATVERADEAAESPETNETSDQDSRRRCR